MHIYVKFDLDRGETTGINTWYASAIDCFSRRVNSKRQVTGGLSMDFLDVAIMVTPPYRDRGCRPAWTVHRDGAAILARTSVEVALW
jgi:hypothetical protein